jgi:uracil-DNA glycosylase family 4
VTTVAGPSALADLRDATLGCTRCPLAATRTQVVFGSGAPDAELMFVGEAPGFHEDQQGVPFVGQAGKLLERLLNGIGLTRADVYVANVLKCLRYDARVQLGDGSWERIGRLVRARYDGTVATVLPDGTLGARRVTGWHTTPLGGRRVFKLSFRSARDCGASRSGIQLTGDHPVLTERGYVPVQELDSADRIAIGSGLSQAAFDAVCGTILGDGHLRAASGHLTCSHSERQREWVEFKAFMLQELEPRLDAFAVAAVSGGARAYGAVQLRTRAHPALRVLRSNFYETRKRVPRWLADGLNERMLAVWFMDDGHMRVRDDRQPLAEIASNGFGNEDIQILLEGLRRLGLAATSSRSRIYFGVAASKRLSELIAPYVPPSMRYKLHPDVESTLPFDGARWAVGAPRVMYDEVEVTDVTDRPRTDTTFFCIDVEETHNFVTAGGVVHNCRPPGNRDPHPDEIEACEAHLFRQIELIRPRLVATLGNFATKLLSGRPTGITRVHGVEHEVTLGGNRVTLYPLFHPAAALYTPSMQKVLEADFARIPELLGRPAPPPPLAPPESLPAAQPVRAEQERPVQLGLF